MPKATNKRRKTRTRNIFFLSAGVILSVAAATSIFSGALAGFERRLLDFRFVSFNQDLPPSQEIVFVDVDDVSLETLSDQVGGWPWPRGMIMADLVINYVMAGNPSVLLMDIVYSTLSPKGPNEPISDEDLWMADISSIYPNVSHAVLFTDESWEAEREVFDRAEDTFEISVDDQESALALPEYNFFLGPYEPLASASNMLHSVNHMEDADGISRTNQIILEYEDNYYPGLALRGLMEHEGVTDISIHGRNLELSREEEVLYDVPLQTNGTYRLNYYPDANEFAAYPADNVIASAQTYFSGAGEPQVSLDAFENKIVIIGSSALGLKDIKVTPIGNNVAGPYLHMTAISNILEGHHLSGPGPAISAVLAVLLTVAILSVTLLVPNGTTRAIVGAVLLVIWLGAALAMFRYFGIVLEMASTLVAALLAYIGGLAFTSLNEAAEKNKISSAMGKYLAPAVMNEVLDNYDELIGEVGEERDLTILFSDIRSFSSISESYNAQQVVEVLNRYLEEMISVVFDKRGTLDKIIGDAIMAFWGAPNPEEGKERLALETALEMVRRLPPLNQELAAQDLPTVKIGVGLHSGNMIVGNIGSAQRLDYTAIGDNVNLGSRLEGLTKYYKYPILASEPTCAPLTDEYTMLFVDTVAVKGKTQGIGIYAPIDPEALRQSRGLSETIELFGTARRAYADRDFETAESSFAEIARDESPIAGLATVFRKRCANFRKTPPPENWSGVWTMSEK